MVDDVTPVGAAAPAGGAVSGTAGSRVPALELAVQDVAGVDVAASVGARRVELCAALGATGGMTPGPGLLAAAVERAGVPSSDGVEVHVLVRPRPGGFVLVDGELDVQVREVAAARAAGAHGVVVGASRPDGTVDAAALRELVAAADGLEVTFHRAFDQLADPFAALDVLAGLGVARVLTSGGAARCADGVERLAACVAHTRDALGGAVQVMAGGGVRVADVPGLVAAGVDAVHLSAKRVVSDDGGPGGGGDSGYEVTDPEVASAAAEALRSALWA
ncbi:copper homeostasis protein CutC [Isoptericola chiayiensis]|uniref:PF03932 family protein CutC n=1 Tax=Isoptericola chiayiensis TaxID=579446 RepID=A0ABP8XY50_9MICO|nr:copper homeostasis protein CutC [Isoptericola chiayiensis]NOW02120.1 copper homeostasis protein [Isoptericola chiayiensis]